MRFVVSVVLLLSLGPICVGWGGELGGGKVNAQAGGSTREAKENPEPTSHAQNGEKKPLTNDDVMSMVKAGLAEATIVLAIQHSSTAFDTSPQALISLHSQGVPQTVLDAMLTAGSQMPTPPSAPPAPTKIKANPPDLHTIRKVFLETGWAEDDVETAKKVIALQKHTCLQVVETKEAADATLSWEEVGFTGAALELHSKDGQVLWSKVGTYTTPLKALKQALGCPK